ncbi:transcriptional regulator [Salmonella enterica subsp. arizonae]|uniref:Transcriptional regulator n=1 Tax=Salmonella enterica subsp. arizonae TaxID=59203 RepID=A0A379TKC8_SALER|nr:transcriptional regulator [Salmonella enterica subsp. arizonae]
MCLVRRWYADIRYQRRRIPDTCRQPINRGSIMATMLDVSRYAGVSKATVSRVLNGMGQVKESTRQKVFMAM